MWSKPVGKKHKWEFFFKNGSGIREGRRLKPFGDSLIIGSRVSIEIVQIEENYKSGRVKSISISGDELRDFLPVDDHKFALLTRDNRVGVYDNEGNLLKERTLEGYDRSSSLAICDKGEYLFINQELNDLSPKSTAIVVLSFTDLSELTRLSMNALNLKNLQCFSVLGYIQDSIIVIGMTNSYNPNLISFKYDIKENTLEELEKVRKMNIKIDPVHKFLRKDGCRVIGISQNFEIIQILFYLLIKNTEFNMNNM